MGRPDFPKGAGQCPPGHMPFFIHLITTPQAEGSVSLPPQIWVVLTILGPIEYGGSDAILNLHLLLLGRQLVQEFRRPRDHGAVKGQGAPRRQRLSEEASVRGPGSPPALPTPCGSDSTAQLSLPQSPDPQNCQQKKRVVLGLEGCLVFIYSGERGVVTQQ